MENQQKRVRRARKKGLSRHNRRALRNRLILRVTILVILMVLSFVVFSSLSGGDPPEAVATSASGETVLAEASSDSTAADEAETAAGETGSPATEASSEEVLSDDAPGPQDSVDSSLPDHAEVAGFFKGYEPARTAATAQIVSENVQSSYAVLINADDGTVTADRGGDTRIPPASMTKILTLLVAAEHVTNLDDTFTMTIDITDYAYKNDSSIAGFSVGENVTVRDLMYGTILPSGADAAVGLATYVAGSHEAFVAMMNDKLAELGLSDTAHFTNCVGLYDDDHYCTLTDMAMIMKAAAENDLCRMVLSEHVWTTAPTPEHPEGITLSNWFLRRIEDKDTHGLVRCAKTGFVKESGNCAASYQISNDGGHYICVTANAHSAWRCIYDHVAVYDLYTK